jgi:outer membrane protein OmpA-like peptidoglycan-associated protein
MTLAGEFSLPLNARSLSGEAQSRLDAIVRGLAGVKLEVIIVVAWVGSSTTGQNAQKLANEVATMVKDYLIDKGISKNQIYAEGKVTEANQEKNGIKVGVEAVGRK